MVNNVDLMYYRLADYDRLLDQAMMYGKGWLPPDTVHVEKWEMCGAATTAAYMVAGKVAGVAVLWDTVARRLVAVGTRLNLDELGPPTRYRPCRDEYEAGLECLMLPDTKRRAVHEIRRHRCNAAGVGWRVVELVPGLREKRPGWAAHSGAAPALAHQCPGWVLGGAPWANEWYLQGGLIRSLRLRW